MGYTAVVNTAESSRGAGGVKWRILPVRVLKESEGDPRFSRNDCEGAHEDTRRIFQEARKEASRWRLVNPDKRC